MRLGYDEAKELKTFITLLHTKVGTIMDVEVIRVTQGLNSAVDLTQFKNEFSQLGYLNVVAANGMPLTNLGRLMVAHCCQEVQVREG